MSEAPQPRPVSQESPAQQGSPAPPQAMQVSAGPQATFGAVQRVPRQQGSPAPPQPLQLPESQVVPPPQPSPLATQEPNTQQPPPSQAPRSQQSSPGPPQLTQLPPSQVKPSAQAAPAQQTSPPPPQAVQLPPTQTPSEQAPPSQHSAPRVPQVLSGSQSPSTQTPSTQESPQQARPIVPQSIASTSQVPPAVQTRSLRAQSPSAQQGWPSPPHSLVPGTQVSPSQTPSVQAPAQQGSPSMPQELGSMQKPPSQLRPASQRVPSQHSAPRSPQIGSTDASALPLPPSVSTTVDSPQPKASSVVKRRAHRAGRLRGNIETSLSEGDSASTERSISTADPRANARSDGPSSVLSLRTVSSMRQDLLDWYDEHRRALPWRETRDPYAIWVSEVMCQQTRVDTAIPYYHRFLERFPDVEALAAASEGEVLAAWSGLGYYRRARMLHAGVKEVADRYGGRLPKDPEARRGLPGVGRYTAGALGSIAFDLPEPIVDGNVARVLSRVFRIETPLGRAATERALWDHAESLVEGPRPGDFNQALMELGAMVCTPREPSCGSCPWQERCAAHAAGVEESLPVPRAKKKPRSETWTAVVATRGSGATREVFLQKRAGGELFGGLWMVPMVQLDASAADRRAEARRCLGEHELRGRVAPAPAGAVTHVLSHRRYEVEVWRATGAETARRTEESGLRPYRVAELRELGVARLTHKIVDAALGED